jgi:predicted metal-dependent phosphoesterase TrpH
MGKKKGETQSQYVERLRRDYPLRVFGWWKDLVRRRSEATAELTSFRAFRGDLHIHSTYSDGIGTVEGIKAYADRAGLDFLFITDHNTVLQKRNCRKLENVWWGQEVDAQGHHFCVLGLDRKYSPKGDLVRAYRRAEELGCLTFIAHPTGWFPTSRYTQERINILNDLGSGFTMEIINGANQVFDCFDETDRNALALWDDLLSQGKRVTAIACTDAHLAEAVGDLWTGVLARRCAREDVFDAIRRGHCYASDGPALCLWHGKSAMGDVVKAPRGELTLRYECADSRGLDRIHLVSQRRVLKAVAGRGKCALKGEATVRFSGGRSYYRLECFAVDERRAYGNPIYVLEA